MEKDIFEIREDELSEVNGGLSADDVKSLKPGETLILENDLGENIAVVVYEGEWINKGTFYMLQAKVRVIELLSSYVGERALEVGDVIYVRRCYLDYPERA